MLGEICNVAAKACSRPLGGGAGGNALMATLVDADVSEVVTAFGEKGVSAEQVANTLVRQVRSYTNSAGALGAHLADQWRCRLPSQ